MPILIALAQAIFLILHPNAKAAGASIEKQIDSVYHDCGPNKTLKDPIRNCWQKRIFVLHDAKNDKAALEIFKECSERKKFIFKGVKESDQLKECLALIKDNWPPEMQGSQEAIVEVPIEVSSPRHLRPMTTDGEEIGKANGGRCDGTTESKARLNRLEDVPRVCLNNPCDAAKTWNACPALEDLELEKFAGKEVRASLAYIDADSVVYLTRASIVDLILKSYEGKTSTYLKEEDIPKECRKNAELFEGMKPSNREKIPAYNAALPRRLPSLKRDAIDIQRLVNERNNLSTGAGGLGSDAEYREKSKEMEKLLLRNPELLPHGYKGGEELQVALGLAALTARSGADIGEQLEFLRKNLSQSVQFGLKEACNMGFKDLLRQPFAKKIAQKIAESVTLMETDGTGKKYSRIWACLKSKVDEPSPADILLPETCWALLTGVSVGLMVSGMPPMAVAAQASAATCVLMSTGKHFVDLMSTQAAQTLNWSCVNSRKRICDGLTQKKLSRDLDAATQALAMDFAVIPLGKLAEPVLEALARPVARRISTLGLEWINSELAKIDNAVKAGLQPEVEKAIEREIEKRVAAVTAALGKNTLRSPAEMAEMKLAARTTVGKRILSGELKPPPGAPVIRIRTKAEMAVFEGFDAQLSDAQKEALAKAHDAPTLREKVRILTEAEIPYDRQRDYIESYICGDSSNPIKGTSGATPLPSREETALSKPRPRTLQTDEGVISTEGDARFISFEINLDPESEDPRGWGMVVDISGPDENPVVLVQLRPDLKPSPLEPGQWRTARFSPTAKRNYQFALTKYDPPEPIQKLSPEELHKMLGKLRSKYGYRHGKIGPNGKLYVNPENAESIDPNTGLITPSSLKGATKNGWSVGANDSEIAQSIAQRLKESTEPLALTPEEWAEVRKNGMLERDVVQHGYIVQAHSNPTIPQPPAISPELNAEFEASEAAGEILNQILADPSNKEPIIVEDERIWHYVLRVAEDDPEVAEALEGREIKISKE